MTADRPGFPGGTAVSHLTVYDWPTADGLAGGSPHLHTASGEGYVVVGGKGRLQTLSGAGVGEHPLSPGTVLWFTPGTVHRLVNDGGLEIVVVMQNAGLPEAGDAVFTFPRRSSPTPSATPRPRLSPTPPTTTRSRPPPGAGATSPWRGTRSCATRWPPTDRAP